MKRKKHYNQALSIEEKLAGDYPSVPDYSFELAGSYNNRGILLQTAHRAPEAEQTYDKALTLLEKLVGKHPGTPSL